MGWESSGVVGFDLGPLLQGQMRTAKLKSPYNSLIIGPHGKPTYRKSCNWESSGVVGFMGPFQGQMRTAKPKSAYNSLIIGPRGLW